MAPPPGSPVRRHAGRARAGLAQLHLVLVRDRDQRQRRLRPVRTARRDGTVTSVTLPAMPHPGQMEVDVLTSTAIINNSREAEAACCSVKEVSAPFTVPANQVTTVPLNLPVSSTPNIYNPGETQKSDIVAISVLDGTSTFPLRTPATRRTSIGWPSRRSPRPRARSAAAGSLRSGSHGELQPRAAAAIPAPAPVLPPGARADRRRPRRSPASRLPSTPFPPTAPARR